MDIADLRSTYRLASLAETDVASDPFAQFELWLNEAIAAKALEPTAMTLATVDHDGRPSARIVLLKGLDVTQVAAGASDRGFCWYTNYESHKGHDLAIDDRAALCFFWAELERQVRVEGRVEKTGAEQSDRYYASRPLGSRIGAWASPQSEVVASRHVLEEREAAIITRFAIDPADESSTLPRPPHWGGYRLVPDLVEFWQGRPSRLHDRLAYRRHDSDWTVTRLAP